MKKTEHFNRIKQVLNNPENNSNHLPALKNMVQNYQAMFGDCNLSQVLWMKYFNLYTHLNF